MTTPTGFPQLFQGVQSDENALFGSANDDVRVDRIPVDPHFYWYTSAMVLCSTSNRNRLNAFNRPKPELDGFLRINPRPGGTSVELCLLKRLPRASSHSTEPNALA